MKKTITDIDVSGKRVLTRVDFNVPMADGAISDDRRIRMALPTIRSIIDRGGSAVLMSHLGRPGGKGFEAGLSLEPIAARLSELLGQPVKFAGRDCVDAAAIECTAAMQPGEVAVLENLRFHGGEKKGDVDFAAALARHGDAYCNDAFGTSHREDASMVAVPRAMTDRPRVAGKLLERELAYLSNAIDNAERPFVAVQGGVKVSDKLGALTNLMDRADAILIGGAMAYTLLRARDAEVGDSLVETDKIDDARAILEAAEAKATPIVLPVDHVCRGKADAAAIRVVAGDIPAGWMGFDIGPRTGAAFVERLSQARTIVWNGPMGVFETSPFDVGTKLVAQTLALATDGGAITIVGGGDSAAAVEVCGVAGQVSHVSTGGGASMKMLEGGVFASVEVLDGV